MKFKKSLVGAVLVVALSGGGFAAMAAASTSAPGATPGKIGEAVDGPPPAGVTVTPGVPADALPGEIGEAVDGPPPAGVTVTPGVLADPAR